MRGRVRCGGCGRVGKWVCRGSVASVGRDGVCVRVDWVLEGREGGCKLRECDEVMCACVRSFRWECGACGLMGEWGELDRGSVGEVMVGGGDSEGKERGCSACCCP